MAVTPQATVPRLVISQRHIAVDAYAGVCEPQYDFKQRAFDQQSCKTQQTRFKTNGNRISRMGNRTQQRTAGNRKTDSKEEKDVAVKLTESQQGKVP